MKSKYLLYLQPYLGNSDGPKQPGHNTHSPKLIKQANIGFSSANTCINQFGEPITLISLAPTTSPIGVLRLCDPVRLANSH